MANASWWKWTNEDRTPLVPFHSIAQRIVQHHDHAREIKRAEQGSASICLMPSSRVELEIEEDEEEEEVMECYCYYSNLIWCA